MKTDSGLTQEDLAKICAVIRQQPKVTAVILFGSRAKGNYRAGSDIDLALKGNGISTNDLAAIETSYQKLYLPWKLDLIIYDTIENAALKEHVDRVGIQII
jgi:predicted nucleotidyltransferase